MPFLGSQFIGGTWENGFGIRFAQDEQGRMVARHCFTPNKEGPPRIVQGGAIAAVLDEAMTAAIFTAGFVGFTVNLNVNYRAPVFIGAEAQIVGYIERVEGRKIFTAAQIILSDNTVATEATALFLTDDRAGKVDKP